GVVDAREIDIELAAPFLEKMREQERHLVVAERPLLREEQLVPLLLAGRLLPEDGLVLVPAVRRGASRRADAGGEDREELERAGHLPAAEVAAGRAAPDVRCEGSASRPDESRHLHDLLARHAALG